MGAAAAADGLAAAVDVVPRVRRRFGSPPAIRRRLPPSSDARRRGAPTRSPASRLEPGAAFASPCAPPTASAAESSLRALLDARLDLGLVAEDRPTAVRTRAPFFDHLEVWPDLVLEPLRVAIEYDSTGRDEVDRRKDRLLREAGWEVVRIRTGRLPDLGPHDLAASGVSGRLADRLVDRLGEIRGPLLVGAYLR